MTGHSRARRSPRRKYLCKGCGRTFTDLTGTPLARTNLPLSTWFLYLRLMEEGARTAGLARMLGVKWDTASLLERRIIAAMGRSSLLQQLKAAARDGAAGGRVAEPWGG